MSTREAKAERTLKVPGATLYYEIQGSGPVLLCISGGPTDAGIFTDLAGRLTDRYTVVSYDQRGHSRSPLDREPEDIPVALPRRRRGGDPDSGGRGAGVRVRQ